MGEINQGCYQSFTEDFDDLALYIEWDSTWDEYTPPYIWKKLDAKLSKVYVKKKQKKTSNIISIMLIY